jgi:hypothetical protein
MSEISAAESLQEQAASLPSTVAQFKLAHAPMQRRLVHSGSAPAMANQRALITITVQKKNDSDEWTEF